MAERQAGKREGADDEDIRKVCRLFLRQRLPQCRRPRTRCKTRPRAETASATARTTPRPPGSPPPTPPPPRARSTPTPCSPRSCPPHPSTPPSSHKHSMTISKGNSVSTVLFTSALDTIAAPREAKRSAPLREGVHIALDCLRRHGRRPPPQDLQAPPRCLRDPQREAHGRQP